MLKVVRVIRITVLLEVMGNFILDLLFLISGLMCHSVKKTGLHSESTNPGE
jgi:hypothetical protein